MALGATPTARRSATAHEYVRETLRTAIMDGSLPGGTRLLQSEIATQLGVSTTPVREALRDLTSEHLVVMHPHHGAIVRALDLAEVREIYELRITLEPIMARRLVHRLDDATLDRALELHHRMLDMHDVGAWAQLNRDFHNALAAPEDQSRLGMILIGLRDSATPFVGMSLLARHELRDETNEEHREFIELFRAKDEERVVDLTRRHLQATLSAIEEAHAQQVKTDPASEPLGTTPG